MKKTSKSVKLVKIHSRMKTIEAVILQVFGELLEIVQKEEKAKRKKRRKNNV